MPRIRIALLIGASAAGLSGWYAFRPERAFIDKTVSEAAPAETATVVSSGRFEPLAHEGKGLAQIIRLGTGEHVVRFTGFATLDGPDVRVYLLGADSVRGDKELAAAGYLDLGPLKGNIGDQNYAIPAGTDLSRYRAVSVWCRRFAVNFTAAVLADQPESAPARGTAGT